MKLQQGTPEEIRLALLPLSQVKDEIAADLQTSGGGARCGGCDKPFNMTRKPRGVIRITLMGESGLTCHTWQLCGACEFKARHSGKLPTPLLEDARHGYEALRLLQTRTKGCA